MWVLKGKYLLTRGRRGVAGARDHRATGTGGDCCADVGHRRSAGLPHTVRVLFHTRIRIDAANSAVVAYPPVPCIVECGTES